MKLNIIKDKLSQKIYDNVMSYKKPHFLFYNLTCIIQLRLVEEVIMTNRISNLVYLKTKHYNHIKRKIL